MTMTLTEFCMQVEEGVAYIPPTLSFEAVEYGFESKPTVRYTEVLPAPVTEKPVETFRRELRAVIRESGAGGSSVSVPRPRDVGNMQFRYVWQNQGDCLVGRVLIRMGVPVSVMSKYEGTSADAVVGHLWGRYGLEGNYSDMETLCTLARRVQAVNDSGSMWGLALSL